jgi:CRISPR/Cas system CSM-associated protein Csm2 small subunit
MRPRKVYDLKFDDHREFINKSKMVMEAIEDLNKMMIVYCDERNIDHHEVDGLVEVVEMDKLSKHQSSDITFMRKAILNPVYNKIGVKQLREEIEWNKETLTQ